MSKKTVALIAGLTILTLILVVLALGVGQKPDAESPSETPTDTEQPTPTVPAFTTLELSPNPVSFTANTTTIEVVIDTSENEVTGAQFDLVYDPQVVTLGPIRLGDFFTNSLVFINDTSVPGRVTYMVGLTPAQMQNPKTGTGTVATFTVTKRSTAPATGTTEVKLENVLISGKDLGPSVLKEATGTTINLTNSATSSGR